MNEKPLQHNLSLYVLTLIDTKQRGTTSAGFNSKKFRNKERWKQFVIYNKKQLIMVFILC